MWLLSDLILPDAATPAKSDEIFIPKNYTVFVKPTEYAISQRKLEGYRKLAEIRAYYQRNPVKFMEEILGIKLLDSQAYCVANSWNTPYVLWTCSRGWGKSTIVDAILMSKSYLNPNYTSYIAAGSSEQSIQTFQTLYKLANQSIESMTGLTDLFKQEVEVKNASGDGFVRNPAGNYVSLYNSAMIKTLNSNIDRRRGLANTSTYS